MSSPEPPAPPRCTINDLPTELKQRIVAIVAVQDENYNEWATAIESHLSELLQAELKAQKRRYGHGVGALFRTSREWSALATPFRFKVLKASKANANYQFDVALRARPFTEFHLDTDTESALLPTLAAISAAQTVDKLVLHRCALDQTSTQSLSYARVLSGDSLKVYLATTLNRLSSRVPDLELVDPKASQTSDLLRMWKGVLRSLTLRLPTTQLSAADASLLASALSRPRHLTSLNLFISALEPVEDHLRVVLDAFAAQAPPPIQHLSLITPLPRSNTLTLLALFSSTLTSLRLESTCLYEDQDDSDWDDLRFDDDVKFPNLQDLTLCGTWEFISALFEYTTREIFSAVQHFTVILEGDTDFYPSHIPFGPPPVPEVTANVTPLPFPDPPLVRAPSLLEICRYVTSQFWPTYVDSCEGFVDDLGTFICDEVERARRTGDKTTLTSLAEALKPVELERMARIA
ncbi:hypothetical protein JCM10207_004872 [Rhodosporidiobolus poonsookiae]